MAGPFRQGDIMLTECPVPELAEARAEGGGILARGEQTGHHHALHGDYEVLTRPGVGTFVRVGVEGAELRHDEHATITLPPLFEGRLVRQREYEPKAAPRRVTD